MQIIFPNSHPMIFGFIAIFLCGVAFLGLIFILHSIYKWRSNKENHVKFYLILGIILIAFPVYNLINYKIISNEIINNHVGNYKKDDQFLNLKEDYKWDSNIKSLDCSCGEWTYVFSEDGDYIELTCLKNDVFKEQIRCYNNYSLEILEDESKFITLKKN